MAEKGVRQLTPDSGNLLVVIYALIGVLAFVVPSIIDQFFN